MREVVCEGGEIPLMLFDCVFEDVNWQRDERMSLESKSSFIDAVSLHFIPFGTLLPPSQRHM